jgi:hypothetical protein
VLFVFDEVLLEHAHQLARGFVAVEQALLGMASRGRWVTAGMSKEGDTRKAVLVSRRAHARIIISGWEME